MTFRKSRKAADEDDSECSDLEDDPGSDEDSDSEQTDFDPKDVIGKLHALIVQVKPLHSLFVSPSHTQHIYTDTCLPTSSCIL